MSFSFAALSRHLKAYDPKIRVSPRTSREFGQGYVECALGEKSCKVNGRAFSAPDASLAVAVRRVLELLDPNPHRWRPRPAIAHMVRKPPGWVSPEVWRLRLILIRQIEAATIRDIQASDERRFGPW